MPAAGRSAETGGPADPRPGGTGTQSQEGAPRGDFGAPSVRPAAAGGAITSAATARDHVRTLLSEHGRTGGENPDAVIDVLLVVSELVTNAIRHGGGLAGFDATLTDGGVRLAVRDNSDVVPVQAYGTGEIPRTDRAHRTNGYGWPLIIRISDAVTVEPCPGGGKTIRVFVPLT
ncbi:ATP-binding protein [Streptomyces populi]|uniref:ATP-binding protein n=1 Tax=Streptomyces populi TaxID=2058924 RepID=UPI0035D6A04B